MEQLIKDLHERKGIDGTEEGFREQYNNTFSTIINEGFFANKVVIVEGDSELYSLPIYAKLMGYDLDINNISIVHSHGKGQIDRLLRIFTGFNIPTYVWFDADKDSSEDATKRESIELLNLLGNTESDITKISTLVSSNYAVIEDNYEKLLSREIDDYDSLLQDATSELGQCGKPLKSRYIARRLEKLVAKEGNKASEIVPNTIQKIIEAVNNLKASTSILKE